MTKNAITLGKAAGHSVTLPLKAVTERFALLGMTGSGKSYSCRVLAEELLRAEQQVVVIDPKGDWWGIRSSADGKKPGFPTLIMGGERGDLPLQEKAGAFVAEFLLSERVPAILDLSDFGEAEMQRFTGDLINALYRLNARARSVMHVVVDEADEFAPQGGVKGLAAPCLGAMNRLQRRGRGRGFGVSLLTQRSAAISKSVLTQAGTLIALRAMHPRDLEPVRAWLEANSTPETLKQMMADVPHLGDGEAYICSPRLLGRDAVRFQFRQIETFDSMQTPEPGEQKRSPKKVADVNLPAFQKKMVAQLEEVKANDPTELKKQVADLKRQVAAKQASTKPTAAVDAAAVERARQAGLTEGRRIAAGEIKQLRATIQKLADGALTIKQRAGKLLDLIESEDPPHTDLSKVGKSPVSPETQPTVRTPRPPAEIRTPNPPLARPDGEELKLAKSERAILQAFYWLRDETASAAKVSFYSNYSATSSSFTNALGRLRSLQLLSGWQITQQGVEVAVTFVEADKPTGIMLQGWVMARLGKAERALLNVLINAGGERLSNEQIAERSGYSLTSSSFTNAIGTLRSIEAAEGYEKDGGTKASDVLLG